LPADKYAFIKTDVTSETDVEQAFEFFESKFGRLDVVINCAGILHHERVYNEAENKCHSLATFEKVIKVNALGTFNVCRLACRLLVANSPNDDGQRGIIINVSSINAIDGGSYSIAYAASKGAVLSMTLPMARDLRSFGVRVMAVAPGFFYTPMAAKVNPEVALHFSKVVAPRFPSRPGHPDEFAYLIESIIRNPMLNGEVIRLDGAERVVA